MTTTNGDDVNASATHKAYVGGYGPTEEQQQDPSPAGDTCSVHYANVPDHWIIPGEHLAEKELRIVQGMRVRVGAHYCALQLEALGEDRFAIICPNHAVAAI